MNRRALVTGIAAFSVAFPRLTAAGVAIEDRLAPGQPPMVIAHRARVGGAPSNSLMGIRNAIDLGIDMVKIDTQVTRDGEYILMHDPTLGTTTNARNVFPEGAPSLEPGDPAARRYLVSDFTLAEISRLRLRAPAGGDHPVPTLDAALELSEDKMLVLLGLHIWDDETLIPALNRYGKDNLLLMTTSTSGNLRHTAEAAGIGVFESLTDFMSANSALDRAIDRYGARLRMVGVTVKQFSTELRETARRHGIAICIEGMWDLDDDLRLDSNLTPWKAALRKQADAYFTAFPETVLGLTKS